MVNNTTQIAKFLRDVVFGGNWTAVNLKETLADVTWQQATRKVYSLNTIAALVHHTNYYVSAISRVLKEQPIDASDKFSFDHPPIQTKENWESLVGKTLVDAENLCKLIEQLSESKLGDTFVNEKYGNYYRNLHGVIEHYHYHLGQIVLIKKILLQADND